MSKALKLGSQSIGLFDRLLRRSLIESTYPNSDIYRNKLVDLLKRPTTVYAGFDATSSSLHVGNLVTIMNLIHFQRHGHRVICLIGDATTRIGDPSGHTHDRVKLNQKTIFDNVVSLEVTLRNIFNNHQTYFLDENHKKKIIDPVIIRNSEWYKGVDVVQFVSDIFHQVRVGPILHKKSISERLKSQEGMNMSEFSYQIFQAYDWLELRRRYDCQLQIGGFDQSGNIYTGHDLLKKEDQNKDAIGLLTPLITNSHGYKLGKSSQESQGSIWLSPDRTTPFQLFQFFARTPDKDVEKYLKIFTLFDEREIEELIYQNLKNKTDVWFCQRKLAEQVCLLIHGQKAVESAIKLTRALYQRNPLDIARLNDDELEELFEENSLIKLLHQDDLTVRDLLQRANCFRTDIEAEKMISAGGLWINGAQVTSFNVPVTKDLIIGNNVTIMRVGKKSYYLFKWGT